MTAGYFSPPFYVIEKLYSASRSLSTMLCFDVCPYITEGMSHPSSVKTGIAISTEVMLKCML